MNTGMNIEKVELILRSVLQEKEDLMKIFRSDAGNASRNQVVFYSLRQLNAVF